MTTIAIIKVSPTVDAGRLHSDDAEVAGSYVIAMGNGPEEYPTKPRRPLETSGDMLTQAALDAFHDRIAISVPDQFEVGVAILGQDDEVPSDAHWL